MASSNPGPKLLAGFYDPVKRNREVMERLGKELERFAKLDFTKPLEGQYPPTSEFPKEKTLESIQEDIKKLQKEVDGHKFVGEHFTKQYRTFQGGCDKLLQQLDSLNVENDDERKRQRGVEIENIQKIVAQINKQVHLDGKCCKDCELFGTIWQ